MLTSKELKATLRRILPSMDADVSVATLMKALETEMDMDADERKAIKSMVKSIAPDMLHLDDDDEDIRPRKKTIAKKTLAKKTKHIVQDSDDEAGSSQGEPEPSADSDVSDAPPSKPSKRRVPASDSDESDNATPVKKPSTKKCATSRRAASSDDESSPAPKKRKTAAIKKPAADAGWASDGLEQLKLLARTAGVLAPAIYKKIREAPSLAAAEDLVRDRLLAANVRWQGRYPGKHDVAAMKRKRDLARELDGMDTSLIIDEGPRRARRDYVEPPRKALSLGDDVPPLMGTDESDGSSSEASFTLHDDDDDEEEDDHEDGSDEDEE
ncbi:hypothetical protein SPRG_19896 [Saprolegnia parasitica CBS 223.65]|uniref:Histone chaperone domain-containing protein n=1 Tax=Saprolegnia parasitica (strain CBS 223.65) TaxID=695850 RepID=A0A067CRU6_SAPPC|nr:hypothetical protein SPRG_19896 [Saprolegnia parasitica CBS 223.65]KDO29226.1 hypothetical protein SPRG_19896 [Saprolegnia parasitica CBS 223.65]|eukprot:XP_012200123.1 hypothetical protein SPRG_19896 [Saprolegnia parasitica CBS 223.65]